MGDIKMASMVRPASSHTDVTGPIPVDIFQTKAVGESEWDFRTSDLETYLASNSTDPCFVFMDSKRLQKNDERASLLHSKLQEFYGMPPEVWSDVHWESNGFFGCGDLPKGRHDTWFRFLVKQLFEDKQGRPFPQFYTYDWYKMGFFSTWSQSGRKSILCLDCPKDMVYSMRKSLDAANNYFFLADPYSFHQVIVRGIVDVFDKSIWTLRDVVRQVEKAGSDNLAAANASRSNSTLFPQSRPKVRKPEPDYDHLHEAARHVIHSTETLVVTTQILERMTLRHRDRMAMCSRAPEEEQACMRQVQDLLGCYQGMIYAFRCRSESMQARHQNEISLAFNTVAQYHSQIAVVDAAAMKIIAALTVVFLPATFVAAIFSMSFFNNDGTPEGWNLNSKFWIYWAFTIPLTCATLAGLLLGNRILKWFNMVP
ncbi:hypothetical protein Dda_8726 [Drechslerella dactyloides]|uniref:Uncharacterized protein n=1 Tax=Drechslerella dactyloides TaxID=74499 RepID=A0AAD6IUX9_DREDA|nr:hypothetical protein Dda_8726 [Drechslerella dactyloides]